MVLTNLTTTSAFGAGQLSPYAQSLLATHDGGRHWRDITPSAAGSVGCCTAFFLDPLHGWAVGNWAPGSSLALIVFRTIDGGTSWSHTEIPGIPTGCCPTIDFVDSQHGWLEYGDEFQRPLALPRFLRTVDGGATWTDLPDLPGPSLSQTLILLVSGSPFRFVSPSTGWFVESTRGLGGGADTLYITRDGGSSWRRQDMPLPQTLLDANPRAATDFYLTVPTVASTGEGVLPVTLGEGSRVFLDFTDDGGATWRTDPIQGPLFSAAPGDAPTWCDGAPVSVGRGMMAVVAGRQLEFNSGTGWTVVVPIGLPPGVHRIQFTNQRVGWAVTHGSTSQNNTAGTAGHGSAVSGSPRARERNRLPSRRLAVGGLSPRPFLSKHSAPGCLAGPECGGANDGWKGVRRVLVRFER